MKQLLAAFALLSVFCGPSSFANDTAPAAAKDKAAPAPTLEAPAVAAPRVQVVTSMGNFIIELNAERAPLTVANFLKYVDSGYYSNTIFHRVINNFIIQGGGFDPNYQPKPAPNKVVNESGNGLLNIRATVGMARSPAPHSSDSQFFVNLYDNNALDPNQTRWGYAVFGKVVQGMDVVDRIGNVATGPHPPMKEDAPLKPVIIERVERIAAP